MGSLTLNTQCDNLVEASMYMTNCSYGICALGKNPARLQHVQLHSQPPSFSLCCPTAVFLVCKLHTYSKCTLMKWSALWHLCRQHAGRLRSHHQRLIRSRNRASSPCRLVTQIQNLSSSLAPAYNADTIGTETPLPKRLQSMQCGSLA